MRSWLVIGIVALLIALCGNILRPKDVKWFNRLTRPRWLTFEPLIPLIWTIVLICGAWSAYIVWESAPGTSQTWSLMTLYILLEVLIIAYSPVTLLTRNLIAGTVVGAIGFLVGLILAILVWPISRNAALLLLPYLLWSPIGTYTTLVLHRLNPHANQRE